MSEGVCWIAGFVVEREHARRSPEERGTWTRALDLAGGLTSSRGVVSRDNNIDGWQLACMHARDTNANDDSGRPSNGASWADPLMGTSARLQRSHR
jgi:hypothetical protein